MPDAASQRRFALQHALRQRNSWRFAGFPLAQPRSPRSRFWIAIDHASSGAGLTSISTDRRRRATSQSNGSAGEAALLNQEARALSRQCPSRATAPAPSRSHWTRELSERQRAVRTARHATRGRGAWPDIRRRPDAPLNEERPRRRRHSPARGRDAHAIPAAQRLSMTVRIPSRPVLT